MGSNTMFTKAMIIIPGFILTSCTQFYIKLLTNKPQIENQSSISDFLIKNKFDTCNSYYTENTLEDVNIILKEYNSYLVFDSNGNELYNSNFTCPYDYIKAIAINPDSAFTEVIPNGKMSEIIGSLKKWNGEKLEMQEIEGYKYYVIIFWQKFMGGKKGYKDRVESVLEELKNKEEVLVIKVNSDITIAPQNTRKFNPKVSLTQQNEKVFFQILN